VTDALARTDGAVVHIVDGATLTRTGLTISGDMPYERWEFLGEKLREFEGSVMWWIGDWLNYGEGTYGEKASQALEASDYAYQTLKVARWVSERVARVSRLTNLSWSHHQEVAALEPAEQDAILGKAAEHGMTRKELREFVRIYKRKQTQPTNFPEGQYRVIYADPPWEYAAEQHTHTEQDTVLASHYPSMPLDAICELPVKDLATDDAVLFLWTTSPKLFEAKAVLDAWGFTYKASIVWDKVKHNVGYYVSVRHEFLLIATRGSCLPDVPKLRDSVVTIERTEHSVKPDYFREWIDQLYPNGPRIELFARESTEGWDVWGNQL
jgi:N6-adenosine-specific RNA methylase IME4